MSSKHAVLLLVCYFAAALMLLQQQASAGYVNFQDYTTKVGCGSRGACDMPACAVRVENVHGCTGTQRTPYICRGNRFREYKEVCKGGQLSIDWRIKPLRLQFRNSAGDFEECLLQEGEKGSSSTFRCNMG